MKDEGWIRCDDRLPEESTDNILTYNEYGFMMVLPFSSKHKAFNVIDYYKEDEVERLAIKGIIAWRYIEPYGID